MQSCVDYGPHAYGHDALGGVMGDVQSSPQDPSFFLHHHFVNHGWRIWQVADPGDRTYAIGGSTTQNCGSSCQPTTLDYTLTSYGFYQDVSINDVMDTEGGFLCYHYDY
jgi:tyrosinase